MAGRFEALERLWKSAREKSHDFLTTTDTFPIIDIEGVGRSMELVERGTQNGAANLPVKSARALDEVEQRIISVIEEEKKKSHQLIEDQMQRYTERMHNLDFEGQFGLIRQANASNLSDFKAEVSSGVDELHGLRRELQIAEDELSHFKKTHGLHRAAKVTSGAAWGFKISLIVFLVLIETLLNGHFLAQGSEQGMIGGALEAFIFASLNIGWAVLTALIFIRLIVHRNFIVKVLGIAFFGLYASGAGVINLGLANYRELAAVNWDAAQTEVVRRMFSEPLALTEMHSWALLGLGSMFSFAAFLDACFMSDPYHGFSGVQKRLTARRNRYISRKQDLIDELRDIRDDHNKEVDRIIRELSVRRQESLAIITNRERLMSLFVENQNTLESSANSLLSIYREANRKSRTTPEPKYFTTSLKMQRLKPAHFASEEFNDKDLSKRIETAQGELAEQMGKIGVEFETAVANYHKLDNLFPEGGNVPAQAT